MNRQYTSTVISATHYAMSTCSSGSTTPTTPNTTTSTTSTSKELSPSSELANTPRKRTRATPEQLDVLEKTFNINPSPNNRIREQLSKQLNMSERSIQIWFQNRRAKVKNVAKRASLLHDETLKMQYYASQAAAAACQAAVYQQYQQTGDKEILEMNQDPIKSNPDLYYYYYYYYFNQQQQQRHQKHGGEGGGGTSAHPYASSGHSQSSSSVPPLPISLKTMPPPPPPPPVTGHDGGHNWQYPKKIMHQPRTRAHTIGPYPSINYNQQQEKSKILFERGASAELANNESNTPIPLPLDSNQFYQQQGSEEGNYIKMLNNNSKNAIRNQHSSSNMSISPTQLNMNHNPYLTLQQQQQHQQQQPHAFYDSNSNPNGNNLSQLSWSEYIPFYEDPTLMMTHDTSSNINVFDNIHNNNDSAVISAESLQIGTWKRMAIEKNDLTCSYNKDKKLFSWCIQDGTSRFKMEIEQDSIEKISLTQTLNSSKGQLELILSQDQQPMICFYMELSPRSENWAQCRDYTEDKQASIVFIHQIDGDYLILKQELDLIMAQDPTLSSRFN